MLPGNGTITDIVIAVKSTVSFQETQIKSTITVSSPYLFFVAILARLLFYHH